MSRFPMVMEGLVIVICLLYSFKETMTRMVVYNKNPCHNNNEMITVDPMFRMAYEESLGWFDDISSEEWNVMRAITQGRENNAHPGDPMFRSGHSKAWFQENWDPDFSCRSERKLGKATSTNTVGKWVCDPDRFVGQSQRRLASGKYQQQQPNKNQKNTCTPTRGCIVYSMGDSEEDMDDILKFQQEMERLVPGICEYHTFVPLLEKKSSSSSSSCLFHHPWGWKGNNTTHEVSGENKKHTFQQSLQLLGHHHVGAGSVQEEEKPIIDMVTIHCRNDNPKNSVCDQWNIVPEIIEFADIRQILVKFCNVPSTANDIFLKLQRAGYVNFHKEPFLLEMGSCVEYAYLKLSTRYVEESILAEK